MPAARQIVDVLGAVCVASALASIVILHRLAKANPGTGRADTRYVVRYVRLLGCVFGRSSVSALTPANRRDIVAIRLLHLLFAAAASLMAWSAAPILRAAFR